MCTRGIFKALEDRTFVPFQTNSRTITAMIADCRALLLLLAALAGAATTAVLAAPPLRVPAASAAFTATARGVGKGGKLRVTGHKLEQDEPEVELELQRFEVWQPDAQIVITGAKGKSTVHRPPSTMFFKGKVAGSNTSSVMMSVRKDGSVGGMVMHGQSAYALGRAHGSTGAIQSKKARAKEFASTQKRFHCRGGIEVDHVHLPPDMKSVGRKLQQTVLDQQYVARIAVETDYEFYAKFASEDAAIDCECCHFCGLVDRMGSCAGVCMPCMVGCCRHAPLLIVVWQQVQLALHPHPCCS